MPPAGPVRTRVRSPPRGCSGWCASAGRATVKWSVAAPGRPGRSTAAAGSPAPSGPWSTKGRQRVRATGLAHVGAASSFQMCGHRGGAGPRGKPPTSRSGYGQAGTTRYASPPGECLLPRGGQSLRQAPSTQGRSTLLPHVTSRRPAASSQREVSAAVPVRAAPSPVPRPPSRARLRAVPAAFPPPPVRTRSDHEGHAPRSMGLAHVGIPGDNGQGWGGWARTGYKGSPSVRPHIVRGAPRGVPHRQSGERP